MKYYILIFTSLFLFACSGSKYATEIEPSVDFRATAPEPGPAPKISLDEPSTFQLDNGLTVIVVKNQKLPTVNTSLYFDIPSLVEGDKAGMTSFFGPVMRAGTKNYSKEELDEELDFYAIDLYSSSRSVGFSALKKQLSKAIDLMTEVLFNPTFSNQDELDKLVKQSVTGLEADSKNPDAIMRRVANALMYGKNHPWGEYATAETFQNINLSDLKKHYNTYFKPNIAYLTIVGDITESEAKKLAQENFADWEKGSTPNFTYPTPNNPSETEVAIVNLPNATQSNIYVTNLQNLKKANKDYFAATLGNHMLGGSSFAKLFLNLREDKGYTYGSYSRMGNDDKLQSRFSAYGKFRNEVTDSSIMELMKELKGITTQPLTAEELQTAKSEQTGRFALRLERPETIASYARTVLLEDLDGDFYANYLKNLNAQSPADVLAAMKKYVQPNNARIIIVGKAEDIADDVKKLGYPVKFYDIWANEITDPTIKADVGEMTADDVLNQFFKASGGKDKLAALKSVVMTYTMPLEGLPAPATATIKGKLPNKSSFVLEAMPMGTIMEDKFDGTSGYVSSMGQKIEKTELQIQDLKAKNPIFEELTLNINQLTLDNIVDVNGTKAYKLKYTNPSGSETEYYYAVDSGLLIQKVESMEMNGQQMTSTLNFSDYKEVDGIQMPHTIQSNNAGMAATMTLDSVKFNVNIDDADFK